ncbi:MAG TPA: ATP-binding protein [Myxococcales bacterium]|jgi:two-component system, NtrC family, sensor kinase|nr:ATP-binding protein [Myxococcales bacterium]
MGIRSRAAISLRAKLIALFAAIFVVTLGVSALAAGRLAESAVESEIRERALDIDRTLAADLSHNSTFDRRAAQQKLAGFLKSHRGITAAELAVELPGEDLIIHVPGPGGSEAETREGVVEVPRAKPVTHLDERPDGRFWVVTVPLRVGRSHAGLTLEASLDEADRLASTESQVFAGVAAAGALVLILAAQLLIGRLIGRPIDKLATAMANVEGGDLEVQAPLGHDKEFDLLARGFNTMLARIRGFNQELEGRIDQATADLARKNRDLAELNDLLVAARRDLTAKERLAALGQLAGTIAHELGNPLNSISGHVQLLQRAEGLPADLRGDLATVSAEVERMTGVIRRFLDSTRGLRPAPERVDLGSLLGESLDMSLSAEARSKIQVSREVSAELSDVLTDPSLVRHVVTNLVANAVDAMPEGGALHLFAHPSGGELCVGVRDTGVGISPEERRRIFEPFYTTKPRGKGTGLGLAICREIARALKGRIDVESQVGRGSTFTLWIPLVREAEREGKKVAG